MRARYDKYGTRDVKKIKQYRQCILDYQQLAFTDELIQRMAMKGPVTLRQVDMISGMLNMSAHTRVHMLDSKDGRRRAFNSFLHEPIPFSPSSHHSFSTDAPLGQAPGDAHKEGQQCSTDTDKYKHIVSALLGPADAAVDVGLNDAAAQDPKQCSSTDLHTYARLCAASTKKKPGPARKGAKQAKAMERLQST